MKNFKKLFINDLERFFEYRIFHVFVTIVFIFTFAMALFPELNPSNFIYVSVFVLPVILFSISMYIEKEEGTILPMLSTCCKSYEVLLSKVLAALSLQLIPVILYTLVFRFGTGYEINYLAFIGTYLLGALMHIIVGLTLSILSKSNNILSMSYLAYIVIFSITPILYENGLIPLSFQYVMIISPAYLSGILLGNVMAGVMYSGLTMILIALFLQIIYICVLVIWVILPFLKAYMLEPKKAKE